MRFILPLLLFSFLSVKAFASVTASEQLQTLLDEIWQYELSVNPVNATTEGVHDYDDRLHDISPEGLANQNRVYKEFLSRLQQVNKSALNRTEQINLMMQIRNVQNELDQYQFNAHYVPITAEYGFHNYLASLPNYMRFRTVDDYQNYLKRLRQYGQHFDQQIQWMKKGMEVGMVQPQVVLKDFEKTVSGIYDVKIEDSSFFKPFKDLTKLDLSDGQKLQLVSDAQKVIADVVYPAYRQFYDFLVEQYIPNAKQDIASKTWPNGEAYYNNRIRYFTTTDLSAEQIHQIGLSEVARIRAEMQQIVDKLEFAGDINQFITFLRTDPQFYAKTPKELLKHAAYYSKKIDALLPKLFYTLPRQPYGVAPVPDSIAPKYTTGRYISSNRDDQPGYYWVNTYALDKRPLYAIPALTLHEAVPGHHLQIALAAELKDLPPVRQTYISAFGEGWGLYSEYLGKEVGFYEDEYDDFGRLSYEMWRACRLVVDTGMHLMGWTRQQAMDYMLENTALSAHNVQTEIDRYISWPAQALSYKIGELEIKKLRAEAEQTLGNQFDLRAFHDAVLAHGSVPLSVLRENIELFIAQQKSKQKH